MRILVLTLMMSFLSHSAFGAAAEADVLNQRLVTTFAGTPGASGHQDGQRDQAQFSAPSGLLKLNDGRVLVADAFNQCIRCIDGDQVTTFAGIAGAHGHQDGPGNQAQFSQPRALLQLRDGRILVADSGNDCIRCIGTDGQVTTFAGTPGASGHQDGQRDQAQFACPIALLQLNDGSGRILVAEIFNPCIRCIDGDQVTTFAGIAGAGGHQDGPKDQAQFASPEVLLQLNDGRILVADTYNYCIRCIGTDGQVTTFAGTPGASGHQDGQRDQAQFACPRGLLHLNDGRILVADSGNHCIRCIGKDGLVTTFAGRAGAQGHQDGAGDQALFVYPRALLELNDGRVLVADLGNHCIRCIDKYTIREKITALKIHRYWRMCSSNPDYKLARKLVLERASISDDEKEESDGGEEEAKE